MREYGFNVHMEIEHVDKSGHTYVPSTMVTEFTFSYDYHINGNKIERTGPTSENIDEAFAPCIVDYRRYKNYVEDVLLLKKS